MNTTVPATLALVLAVLVTVPALSATPSGGPAAAEFLNAMEREHAGDSPLASPAAETAPGAEVEAEEVVYATLDGTSVSGYLARPASGEPTAGILVIHEWWGLNDNIRAMTRRLAGEGYLALAVNLYEEQAAEDPERARELAQASRDRGERIAESLRQARRYLVERGGVSKVGVIGWCFGGAWSLETALLLGDGIDAAVMYYGRPVTERERLAALEAPLLGVFGAEDTGIPVEAVRQLETTLRELGKDVTIHVYEGADHAFANPSGSRYHPEAAEDAWGKTVAFFAQHLG